MKRFFVLLMTATLFLSAALLLSAAVSLDAASVVPLTRNPDPASDYVTYEEWRDAHPETGTRSKGPDVIRPFTRGNLGSGKGLLALVVAENINSNLEADLDGYIADLEARGWSVEYSTYSTAGTAEELKDYLAGLLNSGLVGAVLVGELPFAWFQIANDADADGEFSGYPYDFSEEFPCDLFLCDLDGVWEDDSTFTDMYAPLSAGSDGRSDFHSGDRKPEIWVCRIDASGITFSNPLELYQSYFQRIHDYRERHLTLPSRGLFYVDDDWVEYFPDHETALVCDTVDEERNPDTTCADDYSNRLKEEGLYLTVLVHSDPAAHYFMKPDSPSYDMFYNFELAALGPQYGFYNLFACSNCRWIEQNTMGSIYHFYGNGLASIGSTKTGSMLEFNVFNTALGQGKCWGDAFLDLTDYWMTYYPSQGGAWDQYSRGWYMGMCLLGDATLDLGPQHPAAIARQDSSPPQELMVNKIVRSHAEVRLSLPEEEEVCLALYDASGRLVDRIYSGTLSAGEHTFSWDAKTAPSGVYFVKLVSARKAAQAKFLILR